MSGFAKEIAKKRKAIKSPYQEQSLKKLDSNLNAKTRDLVREELPKATYAEEKTAAIRPREEKKVTQERKTVEQKVNCSLYSTFFNCVMVFKKVSKHICLNNFQKARQLY